MDRFYDVMVWFLAKDWRTWISHALIGAVLALVFGGTTAIVAYWFRELGQYLDEKRDGVTLTPAHRLDHVMDCLAPFLAVFVLVGLGWVRPY